MKKTILLPILLFPFLVFAQLGEYFYGTGENDIIHEMVEIPGGNILLLGSKTETTELIWLLKIKPNGKVIWERVFTPDTGADEIGYAIKLEMDGNILIVGSSEGSKSKGIFIKCDPNGKLIWRKQYDSVLAIFDVEIIGSNYLLAGNSTNDTLGSPGIVIKTNSTGGFLKQKNWATDNFHYIKKLLLTDSPEHLYAVGYVSTQNGYNFWVKKIDSDLEPVWERSFDVGYLNPGTSWQNGMQSPLAACLAKDSGLWVASTDENSEDILLNHFSPEGELIETINFGDFIYQENPRSLLQLENGDFIISGALNQVLTFLPSSVFILRVSPKGQEVWRKHFDIEKPSLELMSQIQTASGDLCFAGRNFDINFQGYLLKTDLDGNDLPVQIKANVFLDLNENCLPDPGEPGLPNWFLKVDDEPIDLFITDSNGDFDIHTKEGGFSTLQLVNSAPEVYEICQDRRAVLNDFNIPIQKVDFPVKLKNADCSEPKVHLTIPDLVACEKNGFYATVTNLGFASTEPLKLTVKIPEGLTVENASVPFLQAGSQLFFDLEPIPFLSSQNIKIEVEAACDLPLDAVFPITAQIEKSVCSEPLQGPFYSVNGRCQGNEIIFNFENIGTEPSEKTSYQISIDNLPVSDEIEIEIPENGEVLRLPADGRTWRIDLKQTPEYRKISQPVAIVEGCGLKRNGLYSTGFYKTKKAQKAPNSDAVAPKISSGISAGILRETDGLGINGIIEKSSSIEYSVVVVNPLSDKVESAEISLKFSDNLDFSTFSGLASNNRFELKSKVKNEQEIAVFLENLDVSPGQEIMFRFSISKIDDSGFEFPLSKHFHVSGRAILNNSTKIELTPAQNSFQQNIVDLQQNFLQYPDEIEIYGGWDLERADDLKMMSDGSILLSGTTGSYNGFANTEAMFLKINSSGKVDFLKAYDFSEASVRNYGIKIAPFEDGSFMVAGSYNLGTYPISFLARMDKTGNLIWKKLLSEYFGDQRIDIEALYVVSEREVVLSARSYAPGESWLLYAKFDSDGAQILNNLDTESPINYTPNKSVLMPDGSLIVVLFPFSAPIEK